jgi:N-acetylglucosamine malate deacetylase 1
MVKKLFMFCLANFILITYAHNVCVFAPHPDDDIIGCGGSIMHHIQKGNNIFVIYLTNGDAGSLVYSKHQLAAMRRKEALNGLKKLNVSEHNAIFLDNPDGYLAYTEKNIIELINLIRRIKPTIVYMPHSEDNHADHKMTYKLVKEAVGRASGPWFQECLPEPWVVSTVACYEVWTPLQTFNYSEDITDVIDLKINALSEHISQLDAIPYTEAVKSLNNYRGIMTGKGRYAECFYVEEISALYH